MLSDLLLLEIYYDAPETARFYEDLARRYGGEAIAAAISAGYVTGRQVLLGPDAGRWLFWLTDKGRKAAS